MGGGGPPLAGSGCACKIRGDIAFPCDRLVVEVDGWQYHGKHLEDFQRDRARQNLLTIAGWRILRFTVDAIRSDTGACCALIALALSSTDPLQTED